MTGWDTNHYTTTDVVPEHEGRAKRMPILKFYRGGRGRLRRGGRRGGDTSHLDRSAFCLEHLRSGGGGGVRGGGRSRSGRRGPRMGADVDLRPRLGLGRLGGFLGAAEADLPIPRLVVDDLDLSARLEGGEDLHGLLVAHVPLARSEVNKSALKLTLGDEIDTLDVSPLQVNEDLFDTPPVDVVKHPWDAQAYTRRRVAVLLSVIHTRCLRHVSVK